MPIMKLDVRGMDNKASLMKLREIFKEYAGSEVSLHVYADTMEIAKDIAAFSSMSGCRAEARDEGTHYLLRITGTPCRCW